MRQALLAALCLLALACAAEHASQETSDAGASECPDGGVRGPLGVCLTHEACDTCATSAECGPGATCAKIDGCLSCVHRDPGTDGGVCVAPGERCLSSNSCCSGLLCQTESSPPTCGICRNVEDECQDDAGCGSDELVCATQPAPACSCNGQPVKACVKKCQLAGSQKGERCLDTGLCEPIRCTDGFACEPNTRCTPASPEADAHGCAPIACTSFADCPGTACVDGRCSMTTGTCVPPPP